MTNLSKSDEQIVGEVKELDYIARVCAVIIVILVLAMLGHDIVKRIEANRIIEEQEAIRHDQYGTAMKEVTTIPNPDQEVYNGR